MNLLFWSIGIYFVAQKGVNHSVIECTPDNTPCIKLKTPKYLNLH